MIEKQKCFYNSDKIEWTVKELRRFRKHDAML